MTVFLLSDTDGCSSSTASNGNGTGTGTSGSAGSAQCKTGTEAPYANPAGTPLTLPAGTYTVAFGANPSGFYGAHGFSATLADAAPVTVGANVVGGIDVQVPAGHVVTGTVKAPDGTPLANISVAPSVRSVDRVEK